MGRGRYSVEDAQADADLLVEFKKLYGIHVTKDCYRFALKLAIAHWKGNFGGGLK